MWLLSTGIVKSRRRRVSILVADEKILSITLAIVVNVYRYILYREKHVLYNVVHKMAVATAIYDECITCYQLSIQSKKFLRYSIDQSKMTPRESSSVENIKMSSLSTSLARVGAFLTSRHRRLIGDGNQKSWEKTDDHVLIGRVPKLSLFSLSRRSRRLLLPTVWWIRGESLTEWMCVEEGESWSSWWHEAKHQLRRVILETKKVKASTSLGWSAAVSIDSVPLKSQYCANQKLRLRLFVSATHTHRFPTALAASIPTAANPKENERCQDWTAPSTKSATGPIWNPRCLAFSKTTLNQPFVRILVTFFNGK